MLVLKGTSLLRWGLHLADAPTAARVERLWRLPVALALLATTPAFYAELLDARAPLLASLDYLTAAVVLAVALGHTAVRTGRPWRHVLRNPLDLALVLGLLLAAALPASLGSKASLLVRLVVSGLTVLRIVWAMQALITRGGLAYLLGLAVLVLAACGAGFWWLEPTTRSFGDGLWLAFTTAATVGYGDVVPTTPASKIFSVFVVLLGYGVLSLVTAAIAAAWVETEERRIEREILHGMRHQLDALRLEIAGLREELRAARPAAGAAEAGGAARNDGSSEVRPG